MARVSTHVLDTSLGKPAAGIVVELASIVGGERRLIATAVTNADGRTDAPLFSGGHLDAGVYELTFRAEEYLRRSGAPVSAPPFLGDIIVRVGIAEPTGHYHVPLLL